MLKLFFEKLKAALHLPDELELKWLPDSRCCYRGYVAANTIFIFDKDEEKAKETLLHEVVDLLVTKLATAIRNPEVARADEIYNIKEAVVEALRKLITEEEVIKKGSREQIIKELKRLGYGVLVE